MMKMVTFDDGSGPRLGVLDGESIRDVSASASGIPVDLVSVIEAGASMLERIAEALSSAPAIEADGGSLLAPIPRPTKNIIAVGRNYPDHAREFSASGFDASERATIPPHPVVFTKAPTSVIGPGAAIDSSNDPTGTTDYEGELGVVIGIRAKEVPVDRADDHVFGYTIVNDITARELQRRHVQWFIGKSPDTFCPMGPCIVTADEMNGIESATLRTLVNGELRQEFALAEMIFDVPSLIHILSTVMTLEPGDIIATGTGVGVGIGFDPPRYLAPGDRVEVQVDGIGSLVNPVV